MLNKRRADSWKIYLDISFAVTWYEIGCGTFHSGYRYLCLLIGTVPLNFDEYPLDGATVTVSFFCYQIDIICFSYFQHLHSLRTYKQSIFLPLTHVNTHTHTPVIPVGVLLRKEEEGVMGGVTGGVRLPLVWRGGVAVLFLDIPPVMDRDSLGAAFFFMVSCSLRAASVMNLTKCVSSLHKRFRLIVITTPSHQYPTLTRTMSPRTLNKDSSFLFSRTDHDILKTNLSSLTSSWIQYFSPCTRHAHRMIKPFFRYSGFSCKI